MVYRLRYCPLGDFLGHTFFVHGLLHQTVVMRSCRDHHLPLIKNAPRFHLWWCNGVTIGGIMAWLHLHAWWLFRRSSCIRGLPHIPVHWLLRNRHHIVMVYLPVGDYAGTRLRDIRPTYDIFAVSSIRFEYLSCFTSAVISIISLRLSLAICILADCG